MTSNISQIARVIRKFGIETDEAKVQARVMNLLDIVKLPRDFAKRRPRLAKTLALRAHGLTALHRQQISLLKRWRTLRAASDPAADALLPPLLLSVNAIASGLRTTG